MGKFIDLIGQRFGRLTVMEEACRNKQGSVLWKCQCDCGFQAIVNGDNLRQGHTKSCGCWSEELKVIHGQRRRGNVTPTYITWASMKDRCSNPNGPKRKNYKERGIKICERWNSFENFYFDMGERPKGLTIERIDNNGNYEPSNCKWATPKEQARNTRQNRLIEYQGKIMCIAAWAEKLEIPYKTLQMRLERGHSPQTAFNM